MVTFCVQFDSFLPSVGLRVAWVGFGCVELGWVGLCWVGLGSGSGWVGLACLGLGREGLGVRCRVGLERLELSWVALC